MAKSETPSGPLTARRVFTKLLRVPDPMTRKLAPLVLHPEQERVLDAWDQVEGGRYVYDELGLLWAKKCGKSTTIAGLVIAELVGGAEPDREIVIVASDWAQSKDITFASAARFARRHPWLTKNLKVGQSEIVYRETITDERTGGKHVEDHIVRAVPARDARSLHGSNASLTVIDELWTQNNYDVIEALARSPARLHPRVLYATYAGLRSMQRVGVPCWDLWQRWKSGDHPGLFVSYIGGEDGWRSIPWISERFLAAERRRFAAVPSKFTRLYLNQWSAGDEGAFLTSDEIADATDATLIEPDCAAPGVQYSVGVDLGLTHDFTGIVVSHVNAVGHLQVDAVRVWRGTKSRPVDLTDVEREIRSLAWRFKCAVHIDQWQGALMRQRLEQQSVTARVHTIESAKLDGYASLVKSLFVARQIKIPAEPTLIEQLETLEGEEQKRRDRVRFTARGQAHDDLVVALCLSTESFVHWKAQDGRVSVGYTGLGRPVVAEIDTCRAAEMVRAQTCPLYDAPSAHVGCAKCPAYTSAVERYEAYLAEPGAEFLTLRAFVTLYMRPNQDIRERRMNSFAQWI